MEADQSVMDTWEGLSPIASIYQDYEERRALPRVRVKRLPATVTLGDKKRLSATVHNISPDGVQLRCTREVAAQLHPSGRSIQPAAEHQEVFLSFNMASGDSLTDVQIVCSVWYFAIIPDGRVAFGLKFERFMGESERALDKLFAAILEPGQ